MITSLRNQVIGQNNNQEDLTTSAKDLFLKNVKIGDLVVGNLNQEEKVFLLLNGSVKIPVEVKGELELGTQMSFEVIAKEEGKLILEMQKPPSSLLQKVFSNLNLPKTSLMEQLIEHFLEKQLPLTRENLIKSYHMHQNYELPLETLTNLLEQGESLNLQEMNELIRLKTSQYAHVTEGLERLMDEIENPEKSLQVLKSLIEAMPQKVIQTVVEDTFKEMSLEENVSGSMKETIRKLVKDIYTALETKEDFNALETYVPEKVLKHLNKALLKERLILDFKTLKEFPEEVHKMRESATLFKEVLKLAGSYKNQNLNLEVQAQIEVLEKFNEVGQYYYFPFQLNEQKGEGEIYFFRPKTNHNKQKDYLYVVLALEMPHIDKIEVHIMEKDQEVALTLKVKDEAVKSLLEAHIKLLRGYLKDETLKIANISVALLEDELKKEPSYELNLTQMDFKV